MFAARPRWVYTLILLSIAILYIAFCTYFVAHEDPIYVWDFGEFWRMYQRLGAGLGTPGWLGGVANSISTADYNISGALPLIPSYLLFGGGRAPYVATIAALYSMPAVVIASYIAAESASLENTYAKGATLLIAASTLPLLAPTLRGMWDIAGLIPLGIATIVILKTAYLTRATIRQLILVGVSLWAAFLLRRWYAYSVMSLMVVTLFFAMASSRRDLLKLGTVLSLVVKFAIVTSVFCGLALYTQFGLISRILVTDYGELYAAYHKSFSENLAMALERTGILNCIVIGIGFISAVIFRVPAVLFCGIVATTVYFLFTRTQLMGVHHFLPVAFWSFPVLIFGIKSVGSIIRLHDKSILGLCAVFSITILLGATLFPRVFPEAFYPTEVRPLTLDNRDGYEKLLRAIHENRKDTDQVNTFGSSLILSDDLLRSLSPDLADYVPFTPHVASTHPFRFEHLRAQYQIATVPALTQLAPGTQRHLQVPNDLIVEGKGFGSGYSKIGGPYRLSVGVDAFLYKRSRAMTAEDMAQLLPVLLEVNPSWRAMFFESMEPRLALRTEILGDKWGRVTPSGSNSVSLHPGETTGTSITVPLRFLESKSPKSITFSMPAQALVSCPNADGVSISVSVDGHVTWEGVLGPGQTQAARIPVGENLFIGVDKIGNPYCDTIVAEFSM
ncbi:hypothetical protein [Phyllobacterium pellucidum]|uniref:hypothetical protein n=1 Tax=Phyllobacterium pellucidum TaxID=2740464 RepID=UPI001D13DFBC|nr:hypothetical protein [Phyllobacterium sp. T1018]UGY10669.1 hypothetical protein LLE51_005725 [Phyllobacterium sp. T1018]